MATLVEDRLETLAGLAIWITGDQTYIDGQDILIKFSNGASLTASYWRLIKSGRQALSSFDHNQKYGLPALIDALSDLQAVLDAAVMQQVRLDRASGDLILSLTGGFELQVFNFTGYEVWTLTFPDGATEYSNYNR